MAEPLPTQVLLGIYLGVLTGIIPALVSWSLAFTFKYFTNVTVPGLGVVVLAAAIAGVSGGLMGLLDPAISESWVGVVALLVVLMMSLWAHGRGDRMGETFPRRITLTTLRETRLSTDVVDRVGSLGRVRVRVRGEVENIVGYPPLPDDVRLNVGETSWTLPSDLPLSELESRLADRLVTEFDLAEASVTIDESGRATVAAAPAPGALSRRVEEGRRAVSIGTLVPTGVAQGDKVEIKLANGTVVGTVLSVPIHGVGTAASAVGVTRGRDASPNPVDDEIDVETVLKPEFRRIPTAAGGEGRLTVDVSVRDAKSLLSIEDAPTTVLARGKRREYELVSLLREAGVRFGKVTVGTNSPLDGSTMTDARVRETYAVAILAIRRSNERIVAPRGSFRIIAGDVLTVVGATSDRSVFEEAVG